MSMYLQNFYFTDVLLKLTNKLKIFSKRNIMKLLAMY